MTKMSVELEQDKMVPLPAEAGVLVGEDIYFFSSQYNLLYKIHMPDFTTAIVSYIPCGKANTLEWFRKALFWKGKLLFIPSCAEKVWIFDLGTKEWDSIVIDYPYKQIKFWDAVIYKDCVFLLGAFYPAILKIELNNYAVTYLNIVCRPGGNLEEGLILTQAVRIGSIVYSPERTSSYVLVLDLDTAEYEWCQVGSIGNKYSGIACDGENFWISSGECGSIVKWNGRFKWEEFQVPSEIAKRSYQFIGVICDENRVCFLTQQDGRSFEIQNGLSGGVCMSLTAKTRRYIHLEHYENDVIVLMQGNGCLDVKWLGKWIKGNCEMHASELRAYLYQGQLQDMYREKDILQEERIFTIKEYVKLFLNTEKKQTYSANEEKRSNIWQAVK